jgi:ATP-binding cassette subfamily F protein 2
MTICIFVYISCTGVVVIYHDFRLLSKVAEEIWVVDRGLKVWDGDINSYKNSLKKKVFKGK